MVWNRQTDLLLGQKGQKLSRTSVKRALEEGEEKKGTGKVVGVVAARLYKMDKHQIETQTRNQVFVKLFFSPVSSNVCYKFKLV